MLCLLVGRFCFYICGWVLIHLSFWLWVICIKFWNIITCTFVGVTERDPIITVSSNSVVEICTVWVLVDITQKNVNWNTTNTKIQRRWFAGFSLNFTMLYWLWYCIAYNGMVRIACINAKHEAGGSVQLVEICFVQSTIMRPISYGWQAWPWIKILESEKKNIFVAILGILYQFGILVTRMSKTKPNPNLSVWLVRDNACNC